LDAYRQFFFELDNGLYHLLKAQGRSVEMIGCAMAPRGVFEATYEGHRAARRLFRNSMSALAG